MKLAVALWRFARGLLHVLAGWWTIRFEFPKLTQAQREARVQAWAHRMLGIIGVGLQVRGQPANGPLLMVANHISWLDILVIHATRHCRFVSKSDVKHWPLIGTLATGAGTLYIERDSRRDAMRVVHHMAERLRAGDVLAVFPEGTTSDGVALLPFHANLIQAAVSADAPVQPVALRFVDRATGQTSFAPIYIGDDSLVGSIWRTLTGPPLDAVVALGVPATSQGRNRRVWAVALRDEVIRLRQEK